ncbi:MAG: portal protein, partial [Candidatus Poseidoniales archaeon]
LAQAGNGAIVQGRPDEIGVVQVGKTADFATASQMAQNLERRISDGFLQLNVRQSERTTAEEVRLTQLELEQQLGGIFSLLTVEFLVPYLNRTMHILQRNKDIPKIPKDLVQPTIVAGVNALGRGQDRESLTQFITVIAQTMGPESLMQYIDPSEYIKRLAAAQGIDMLNLVKSQQQLDEEQQAAQQQQAQQSLVDQAGQLASSPLADPTKNPALGEQLDGGEFNLEGGDPEAEAETTQAPEL